MDWLEGGGIGSPGAVGVAEIQNTRSGHSQGHLDQKEEAAQWALSTRWDSVES